MTNANRAGRLFVRTVHDSGATVNYWAPNRAARGATLTALRAKAAAPPRAVVNLSSAASSLCLYGTTAAPGYYATGKTTRNSLTGRVSLTAHGRRALHLRRARLRHYGAACRYYVPLFLMPGACAIEVTDRRTGAVIERLPDSAANRAVTFILWGDDDSVLIRIVKGGR